MTYSCDEPINLKIILVVNGPLLWNSIPVDIRILPTINIFKKVQCVSVMYYLDDNIVSFVWLFCFVFVLLHWVTIWLGGTVLLFYYLRLCICFLPLYCDCILLHLVGEFLMIFCLLWSMNYLITDRCDSNKIYFFSNGDSS